MSLRRHLFLLVSTSTLAVWLAVSGLVFNRLMHEADEIFDAELAQYGRLLMAVVKANPDPDNLAELQQSLPGSPFKQFPKVHSLVDEFIEAPGKYERVIGFQITDSRNRVLLRSEGAPELPLSQKQDGGFSTSLMDTTHWRVFSIGDTGSTLTLHVGEQYDIRRELSSYITTSMLLPIVFGIPLIGLLIWWAVSRGLRPLVALAKAVKNREPSAMTPLDIDAVPSEISPLVESLNQLMSRLQTALDSERQFTGDAAHELRTPLAALKVQSQVALKSTDDAQRNKALNQILTGIDRMGHLVDQLLTLSQLDWQQTPNGNDTIGLVAVAREVKVAMDLLAGEKHIEIRVEGDERVVLYGDRTLIYVLIRNLLDNAIHHGDPDGHIIVRIERSNQRGTISVSDDGPGIPADEMDAAFHRFHRQPDSGSQGAGLGLSIVKKIAELHDAEIVLSTPGDKGLRVEVGFPLAISPTK